MSLNFIQTGKKCLSNHSQHPLTLIYNLCMFGCTSYMWFFTSWRWFKKNFDSNF